MKPELAIEIGTYLAGTSEVMARALHANGSGFLATVDPRSSESVPPILNKWPAELLERAKFAHISSMDLFLFFLERDTKADLIFIDGHHDYEFVAYDLAMAAKLIKPGGIIVMDNAELTGVFWAVEEFLRAQPAWRELGTAIKEHSSASPFDTMGSSFVNTAFLILQAPEAVSFTSTIPQSVIEDCSTITLEGLEVSLQAPRSSGVLHARVFLRTFYNITGRFPEQKMQTVKATIAAGADQCRLIFDEPIVIERKLGEVARRFELVAIWAPDDAEQAPCLMLDGKVRPIGE